MNATEYHTVVLGTFTVYGMSRVTFPLLHSVHISGKPVLVVSCWCHRTSRDWRLGDGRAVRCEECGTVYARVGHRIVVSRLEEGP